MHWAISIMIVFVLHCKKLVSCLQSMGDPSKTVNEVTPGVWNCSTCLHSVVLPPFSQAAAAKHWSVHLPQKALVGRRQYFIVPAVSADPKVVLFCLLNKKAMCCIHLADDWITLLSTCEKTLLYKGRTSVWTKIIQTHIPFPFLLISSLY